MIRATTPTLTLTIPTSIDLTLPKDIYVTFEQEDLSLTKIVDKNSDLDTSTNVISVFLSQAETLQFKPNSQALVQVNWVYENGNRGATKRKTIVIEPNLLDRVIEP